MEKASVTAAPPVMAVSKTLISEAFEAIEPAGRLLAVIVAMSLTPVMLRYEADEMEPSSEISVIDAVAKGR